MTKTDISILLIAGHRSIGDEGDDVERQLTDDLAIAYRDTFRAAGYRADIVQHLETGDPRGLVKGGLTGLALATARHIQAAEASLVLALDLHFNTRQSGVHAIVPHNRRQDGRGQLASAFVQGRVAEDIAGNNTLDMRLAEAIAQEIAGIPGMTLVGPTTAIRNGDPTTTPAGVMLENRTRVGAEGSRLGMMGVSAPLRLKAVRLTIEHGGTNDASKPDFFNRCAQASLRAVTATLADRIDTPSPAPSPTPEPEQPPTGDPGLPALVAWLFGGAEGYAFDENGPVSKLWLSRGAETGKYPRLMDVRVEGTVKHFLFADGSVIVASGRTVDYLIKATV